MCILRLSFSCATRASKIIAGFFAGALAVAIFQQGMHFALAKYGIPFQVPPWNMAPNVDEPHSDKNKINVDFARSETGRAFRADCSSTSTMSSQALRRTDGRCLRRRT